MAELVNATENIAVKGEDDAVGKSSEGQKDATKIDVRDIISPSHSNLTFKKSLPHIRRTTKMAMMKRRRSVERMEEVTRQRRRRKRRRRAQRRKEEEGMYQVEY